MLLQSFPLLEDELLIGYEIVEALPKVQELLLRRTQVHSTSVSCHTTESEEERYFDRRGLVVRPLPSDGHVKKMLLFFVVLLWLAVIVEPFVVLSPAVKRSRLCVATVADVETEEKTILPLTSSGDFETAVNGTEDLVVIKFFAPWCRACRGLEPKYKRISVEYSKKGGVKFFEMSHKELASSEPDFLQSHEVNVLPLIQFYDNGQRVESFPCGPRKVELLREKLDIWVHKTKNDQELPHKVSEPTNDEEEPSKLTALASTVLRTVELFKPLAQKQLEEVIGEAKVVHYSAGDVLVAERDIGRKFYVIMDGECDVYQESQVVAENRLSGFSPDATRTAYGVRTNTLVAGSYFGERALAEDQPRQASIVAATSVTALTFERATLEEAGVLDLIRKSDKGKEQWGYLRQQYYTGGEETRSSGKDTIPRQRARVFDSLSVMQRLRLVRSCVRAFEQAASRTPNYGDANEIAYRQNLVQQLTYHQRLEFEQTFSLLDRNEDGAITIDELRNLMGAFGREDLRDHDLSDMLNKANPNIDGNEVLGKNDFLALMAQAEFSAMFLETFKLLDPHSLGFLEADQLWKVLDTLLAVDVSDDKRSFNSFKLNYHYLADSFGLDGDGHIDYAAFVKILLSSSGSSLVPRSRREDSKQIGENTTSFSGTDQKR